MKKDNLSKKDETMIFAISATLMLYVDRIYSMASVNNDDAMIYVNDEDVVDSLRPMKEVLMSLSITKVLMVQERKNEYIDITELLKRVMFFMTFISRIC
jgi:predicted PhzF superfamily epimerase YddE/YHI9